MNHQTIIDLAIAEGLTFIPEANCPLARIVRKAVAMEREECAKACEDVATTQWDGYAASYNSAVFDCAAAIRARAEKETT